MSTTEQKREGSASGKEVPLYFLRKSFISLAIGLLHALSVKLLVSVRISRRSSHRRAANSHHDLPHRNKLPNSLWTNAPLIYGVLGSQSPY